ncbi:16.9 kDa class I heat shock protein 2 [Cryptomeria japonica]|uniref:16.9 kDa class I heat shock protein 2 n=1 Tax=Cryptomeria japonica TaxID=3369 RepID=UPI0027DA006D|nr:16.9 kDa class I heat shock protein 2 [Cryptomeria japonica]
MSSMVPWFGGRRTNAYDPFALDVWDPFDFVGGFMDVAPYRQKEGAGAEVSAVARANVDWKETPEAHVFKADLPGLKKEDIKIQVEDGRILQISGERTKEEVDKNDKYHRVERQSGSFVRRFRLPENAKMDNINARMENGVLTVTVPKAPEKSKPQVQTVHISG